MAIDPDPDLTAHLTKELGSRPGPYSYAAGWMSAKVVETVRRHVEFCADCPTCHDLAELLSMVAAIQIDNPPPPELLDRLPRS